MKGIFFHRFDIAVLAEPWELKNTWMCQLWHVGRLRVNSRESKSHWTQNQKLVNPRAGPGPQKSWTVTARPGPAEISGRSCSILFLSVFLKDFLMKIWTLLIIHLKLSIIFKKRRILEKSSRNIDKKGPARPSWNSGPTGPARPSPLKFVGRKTHKRTGTNKKLTWIPTTSIIAFKVVLKKSSVGNFEVVRLNTLL